MDGGIRAAALSFGVMVALGTVLAGSAMGAELEPGTYSTDWSYLGPGSPPTLQLERIKGQIVPEVVTMQNPKPPSIYRGYVQNCIWEDFRPVGPGPRPGHWKADAEQRGEWEAHKTNCTPAPDPPLRADVEIDPSASWRVRGRIWSYASKPGGSHLINHWWSIRRDHPSPAPPKPPAPICTGDWREPGELKSPMKFYVTDVGSLLDVRWDDMNFRSGVEIKLTGHNTGTIATYDLIGHLGDHWLDFHLGHHWLDFHASGRHGNKLDEAYIRRNHITLNPRNPVQPASC